MPYNLSLNVDEIICIELALESHIGFLRKRFEEQEEFLHLTLSYEQLLQKIEQIQE